MRKLNHSLDFIPLKPFSIVIKTTMLFLSVFIIARYIPPSWLNILPATGGDTGSHFWPVQVLRDYGLPHFVARPWNPGNNGGEGLLVHYFPLPFIFMALLSYMIPTGLAFNLGTLLPVLTLPISVWVSLRKMGSSSMAALLAAVFSSVVLLNEGHSMWGGNTLSTLAGQFAHMYALNFLLLATGYLWSEIRQNKLPWKSALLFSAVATSHGYIYFSVPPIILLSLLLSPGGTSRQKFFIGVLSGLFSFLFSAWFIGPMILNNSWVTPHSFSWHFQNWTQEVIPTIFDPILGSFIVSLLAISFWGIKRRSLPSLRVAIFWFASGIIYLIFFFVFRWLKLVDVRALPQTQLFWGISFAVLASICFSLTPKKLELLLSLCCGLFLTFWAETKVVKFPVWLDWNYSGWQTKNNYYALQNLSQNIRGTLSEPRVAYEHHLKNNHVGTERVFEMLPYFANRATTESLYLQSTILAPMIYSFTSEISEQASCPFSAWPCEKFGINTAKPHMELLGIKQLILSSDISVNAAAQAAFLKPTYTSGPWKVFEMTNPVSMADTFPSAPEFINSKDWKDQFWNWYKSYYQEKRFLVYTQSSQDDFTHTKWTPTNTCHPETRVDFSGIYLTTDCPGVAHYLKYAYHPSFTASGGEDVFLVSPGYLGVVPNSRETKLEFGNSYSWLFFRICSIATFLAVSFLVFRKWRPQRVKTNSINAKSLKRNKKRTKKVAHKSSTFGLLRSRRSGFYCLLTLFLCTYIWISLETDSILFWRWRELNFKDFELVRNTQGYGILHKNENLDGKPIIVRGSIYNAGLATHAYSEILVRMKKSDGYFSGKCGYPDNAFGAEIKCEIQAGNQVLFSSQTLHNNNREERFKVAISGHPELLLIIKSLKPDITAAHGVWVNLETTE